MLLINRVGRRVISNTKSSEATITENTHRIGWKPGWNEERFLQNMDDEVQAVLELGQAKSSGMESLRELARG